MNDPSTLPRWSVAGRVFLNGRTHVWRHVAAAGSVKLVPTPPTVRSTFRTLCDRYSLDVVYVAPDGEWWAVSCRECREALGKMAGS